MNRESLYFVGPRQVEVREESLPQGRPGQILVETLISAISSGTEMLIYRGEGPEHTLADATLPALDGNLDFPLKYGYASVGRVVETQNASTLIESDQLTIMPKDQLVFAFNPHETYFWAHPTDASTFERLRSLLQSAANPGADLVYELSGSPAALDGAIALAGFDGRIVVGSWYGNKRVELDLGGRFHRNRIHMISSQVSTLAPPLRGRWSKARRLTYALHRLSSHRDLSLIDFRSARRAKPTISSITNLKRPSKSCSLIHRQTIPNHVHTFHPTRIHRPAFPDRRRFW